jgi:hypothetical protein
MLVTYLRWVILKLFHIKSEDHWLNIKLGTGVASALAQLDGNIEQRHQELLELIAAQSELVETGSSVSGLSFQSILGDLRASKNRSGEAN